MLECLETLGDSWNSSFTGDARVSGNFWRQLNSPFTGDARVSGNLGRQLEVVGLVDEGLAPLRHALQHEAGRSPALAAATAASAAILQVKTADTRRSHVREMVQCRVNIFFPPRGVYLSKTRLNTH